MTITPTPFPWPLSAAQMGIWLGQQLNPTTPAYNAAECLEIHGSIDLTLFEAALRQAVYEAETLHLRVELINDEPQQYLARSIDWPLTLTDVSQEVDPWGAAQAWMRQDLAQTVDLAHGPLFHEALFIAGPERLFWYQRVHHLALDGFGFGLVARRVAELYTALAQGYQAESPAFASLYEVIRENLAYQASPHFERDRQFWLQRCTNAPEPVRLTAKIAPMSATTLRQTCYMTVAELEKLQHLAQKHSTNWPDVWVAVTAAYLHSYTGATEITLGLPVMGRLGSVSLRIPSMVMNIVPIHLSCHSTMSLTDLIAQVTQKMRQIRPHQRYRYEQLRRDLKWAGGQRHLFGPVVNLMPFDYHLQFNGQLAIAHNISAGPVEDLSIGVYARADGQGIRLDFEANPACYDETELRQHQQQFLQLLAHLTTSAQQPLGELDMTWRWISPFENPLQLPPPTSVVDLLLQQQQTRPQAIALEHENVSLSYAELMETAQALAAELSSQGAGPNEIVAVMVPRSIEAIIAILGVMFSGAGYLPLDPKGPAARNETVLADAQPLLLITLPHDEPLGEFATGRASDWGNLRIVESKSLDLTVKSKDFDSVDLAYVIYTSGSTGQPNGVMISREALAYFVASATLRYGFQSTDRVLQFAPLHFDASVEEIFLTLSVGATLVLRTEAMMQSLPCFMEQCAQMGLTVLDLPTAFWHELAYSLSTKSATVPTDLRLVIIGGEAAMPEHVKRWHSVVGDNVTLLNTYGPTECTVVATVATLSRDNFSLTAVPIGESLPTVQALVLDEHGRPVASDELGELFLLGPSLALGYLGRAELNLARFVTLTQLPHQPRAYRTGDQVRLSATGQLFFMARLDDEFKLSGHRVNLLEIETMLLRYHSIREVAVVGHSLPSGLKRLTAHLVADTPPPPPLELRQYLLTVLPAAVVPAHFSFTDSLPKTTSGKIDRAALRAQSTAELTLSADESAVTEMEKRLQQIWVEVLGQPDLSMQADFFEFGGQSLQTIQIANRLTIELGREVSVAMIFRYPTIGGLAQALEIVDRRKQTVDENTNSASFSSTSYELPMLRDAILPDSIMPKTSLPRQREAQEILLTGATGFVGVHLLNELLKQTSARITCLARAKTASQAMTRICQAMTEQGLPTAPLENRVIALPGDLGLPWLGLGQDEFYQLADNCEAIYHNGSVVSVMREYQSLRAVNVKGTLELLRLATVRRPIPFHYVSTLAVAPISAEVTETFFEAHADLRDGYQQSKWVAERLIQQAAERGLPTAIYRLGRVVGAPQTGHVNEQDIFWRILRAGIPAQVLPSWNVREVWTPVDYIGRAMVYLAHRYRLKSSNTGLIFNLAPGPEVRLQEVFEWVRDYGYPIKLARMSEWQETLALSSDSADVTTHAFFEQRFNSEATPEAFGLGFIHTEHVQQGLAGSGITCPPIDQALLHRYLDYSVKTKWLPAPTKMSYG